MIAKDGQYIKDIKTGEVFKVTNSYPEIHTIEVYNKEGYMTWFNYEQYIIILTEKQAMAEMI